MIISIDTGKEKKTIPYSQDYKNWRKNLSDTDYNQIKDELNRMIDCDEIHTAGWMPGSNWIGTVFKPIYHACGRFQLKGKDIKSLTYFRVNS